MWNEPTKERLSKIPKLYKTENIQLKDKLIYLHFFIAGSDWYIAEFDGQDHFWGYAILNNDFDMAEWGYISFKELKEINISRIEIDCELEKYFPIRKASEIERVCKGNGWNINEKNVGQYSQEDIEELMCQAAMDDILELKCPECGGTLRCEPDACKSYCYECGKIVNTNNPLMALGLI
jgi:hypothetical protein